MVIRSSAAGTYIGTLLLVTGATATRECPHCKETMRRDASVCPHCQRESKPWTFHDDRWWHTGVDGVPYWLDEQAMQWTKFEAPA